MKKRIAIAPVLVFVVMLTAKAQLRIERIDIQANAGIAVSTQPDKMKGAPFALLGSAALETSRGWLLAAEVGRTDFRSAAYPQKVSSLLSKSYLRTGHFFYGGRIGRVFQLDSMHTRVALSVGLNSLEIITQVHVKTGLFGPIYDEVSAHFLNVPAQIDFFIPFNSYSSNQFVVTARGNINHRHSFLMFGLGIKYQLFQNRRKVDSSGWNDVSF